eukprot:UN32968
MVIYTKTKRQYLKPVTCFSKLYIVSWSGGVNVYSKKSCIDNYFVEVLPENTLLTCKNKTSKIIQHQFGYSQIKQNKVKQIEKYVHRKLDEPKRKPKLSFEKEIYLPVEKQLNDIPSTSRSRSPPSRSPTSPSPFELLKMKNKNKKIE